MNVFLDHVGWDGSFPNGHHRARVVADLAEEGATVFAGHFFARGRFEPAGKGFRWAVE